MSFVEINSPQSISEANKPLTQTKRSSQRLIAFISIPNKVASLFYVSILLVSLLQASSDSIAMAMDSYITSLTCHQWLWTGNRKQYWEKFRCNFYNYLIITRPGSMHAGSWSLHLLLWSTCIHICLIYKTVAGCICRRVYRLCRKPPVMKHCTKPTH